MTGVRLLVGGMARSGTTVVQRLLCELDDVWVASETHFWRYAPELARRFEFPLSRADAVAAMDWLLGQPSVDYLDLVAPEVCAQMPDGAALWDLYGALVGALCPPGTLVCGEKTPDHVLWAEPLMDAVPELQVVGVMRDPRAVHRSHHDVPWGITDVEAFTAKWIRHSRNLRRLVRRHGDRVVAARLEDIAAAPDRFQETMGRRLSGSVRTSPLATDAPALFNPGEEWWKHEALDEVEPRGATWQTELSDATIDRIEEACGPEMTHWGYAPTTRPEVEAAPLPPDEAVLEGWSGLPLTRARAAMRGRR